MNRRVDISYRTIIFIAVFLLALWIIYQILDLILILFVATILVSALSPLINSLIKLKVPKGLAIALVYLVILLGIGTLLTFSFTPLIVETSNLISVLPGTINQLFSLGHIDPELVKSQIPDLSRNFLSFLQATFSNFISVIFLLVLTFYLLLEKDEVEKRAAKLFVGHEQRVLNLFKQIEEKLGSWLRGQLFLSILIGIFVYFGLIIIQVPYPLPLAIWAGLLEVIPVIGPIISAIPAVLVALAISPVLAGATVLTYFVIQQLEGHIIVPQVMRKAVGLNPIIVILAVAIGGRLLGLGGALLAVPISVVLQIIATDIIEGKAEKSA